MDPQYIQDKNRAIMSRILSLPAEEVFRQPPVNIAAADEALFRHEYVKRIAAIEAKSILKARILPNGYLMRAHHPLEHSFAVHPSGLRRALVSLRALRQSILSSVPSTIQSGLFITDEFSNGFFHWICDVLPRVETLSSQTPDELRARTVLVPRMADSQYVRDTFGPFGSIAIRYLREREQVRCEDLLVVPAVAPTGNYRPGLMKALRTRFRGFFDSPVASRRIFISRDRAPKRRIANERALAPVLERFGFESVVLEELPFPEQVRLIGSAAVVVGSHGAGLANMCWMEPGTKVLELRRRDDAENNCYYSLASALGVKYFYMKCDALDWKSSSHSGGLHVDPSELERMCAMISLERDTG